jgi:glycosyltransferase involved in cell wall biosynthesis
MSIQFSVIIPTRHREGLLARCLESLAPNKQKAASESYEVIVTDDANEQTAETMIRERFPWAKWIKGPSRGPAANRNNGIRQSKGEWVCFTDDDCVVSPEWIAALHEAVKDESIQMFEGRTIMPDGADDPFLHAITNEKGGVFWSCNLFWSQPARTLSSRSAFTPGSSIQNFVPKR